MGRADSQTAVMTDLTDVLSTRTGNHAWVGVSFADGRTAGRGADWHGQPVHAMGGEGMPTQLIVRMVGGGGGSGGQSLLVLGVPAAACGGSTSTSLCLRSRMVKRW